MIEAIKSAEKVFAFSRIADSVSKLRPDVIKVSRVSEITEMLGEYDDVLILASGDPCFYGITELIRSKGFEIHKIYPGISSIQYMCAKLNMSWHDAETVSAHGRELDYCSFGNERKIIFLTDAENNPSFISENLWKSGFRGTIYAGYDLSYDSEIIEKRNVGEKFESNSDLAVAVVINEVLE